MGREELKKALVVEAEERTRALWAAAEAEIDALRDQVALQREEQEAREARQLETAVTDLRAACRQQALDAERQTVLQAESDLAERMQALATTLLPRLVAADRRTWLTRLVVELPDHPWEEVHVRPEDLEIAKGLFPGAEAVPQETMAGGVVVTADAGRIRVDNSLEKRLERRWPEILPLLFTEIRRKVSEDDDPSATTT